MIKSGIKVVTVKDQKEGLKTAKKILYENVNNKTALFLSGGSTPKPLYQSLAKEKKLKVGAVAMMDERYFQNSEFRAHNSELKFTNEDMIRNTGFISYLNSNSISFYGILENKSLKETAGDYDKVVQGLFRKFKKKVAVLGIGEDGHIAGLPAGRAQSSEFRVQSFVESFDNFPGEFRERITLTFKALSMFDILIVLVFGKEKKKALDFMFSKGPIGEIPSRFLNQPEISKKTLLITDQRV